MKNMKLLALLVLTAVGTVHCNDNAQSPRRATAQALHKLVASQSSKKAVSSGYRKLAALVAAGTVVAVTLGVIYTYAPEWLGLGGDDVKAMAEHVTNVGHEIAHKVPFNQTEFNALWEADQAKTCQSFASLCENGYVVGAVEYGSGVSSEDFFAALYPDKIFPKLAVCTPDQDQSAWRFGATCPVPAVNGTV